MDRIVIQGDAPAEPTAPEVEVTETATGGVQVQPEGSADDRPTWLPEKFKTPEDMAKAYASLEQKMGGGTPEEPKPVGAQEEAEPPKAPEGTDLLETAQAAGVDVSAIREEYAEKGALSEETLKGLESKGINRATVDTYIQGQVALAERQTRAVAEAVGGEEAMNSILSWAKTNLSQPEIDAYNSAVDSGNLASLQLAIQGVASRFNAVNGADPARRVNGEKTPQGSDAKPFESHAQIVEAMKDKRYATDPAYRKQVETRLGATPF